MTANSGLYINITWGTSNSLDEYIDRIEIQASDQTWHEELTGCDSTNEIISARKYCAAALATLTSRPFFLRPLDSVNARIVLEEMDGV